MNKTPPHKNPNQVISILLPDLRGGGVERIRLVLAHEFAKLGHKVEFVLMRAEGELLPEAQAAFTVVDLACPRARNLPSVLSRYLRRRRPDILLAAMWPLTTVAPLAQKISGHQCKVLVSEHGILSAQYAAWGRLHRLALRSSMAFGYRMADARIGVSRGVAEDMAKLAGIVSGKINVIHNPVPPREQPSGTDLQEAEALWGTQPGGRIVHVGRFKAVKNHPLLLQAFARVTNPEARLMLIGSGQEEADLRALAAELGIADRVIFAGFRPDPTPFYQTADLFVLSSNFEGFGNVIVEALACGTPVVSTDCPSGPAEILENGRYGRLVPVNDPSALAEAIEAALAETPNKAQLQQRAAEFSPAIAARQYLDLMGLP